MPNFIGKMSPVRSASAPGSARARSMSTCRIRACGCGLRRIRPKSMRGSARSSANFVCPLTLAKASGLISGLPTTENSSSRSVRSDAISVSPVGRELDGLEDLQVAGATAEYAGERLLDRVARGMGVSVEQRPGGEQHRRGAVPALGGAQLGKRDLQRMRGTAGRHAFDGGDLAALQVERHRQAGEERLAVDQHAAGGALA